MKTIFKTSYIILGGTLLLSSCTQEEAPAVRPDSSDRRIVFHTSLPGLTTKATEIVTDLPHFYMTAFDETDNMLITDGKIDEYFSNKEIGKINGATNYVSDECEWPVVGKESDILHFFAFYPSINSMRESIDDKSFNLVNNSKKPGETANIDYSLNSFKIASDIADQVDFVTAYATGSMADNLFSGISLKFRHQLSRIQVMAKGLHKSCDIEIAGVRIANAYMQGTYIFQKDTIDGAWTDIAKGNAEYIFSQGDTIVTVGAKENSILGGNIVGGYDNCAMLIPSAYSTWDIANDITNNKKGIYLNVLLRIIDKTPTSGKGKQQYPYYDKGQGLNSLNIPIVYLVVDKATGKNVVTRIYKKNSIFYSDKDCTVAYQTPEDKAVKEFGWAALPIAADWQPGYTYTYTLDYTSGVGLHGPDVIGDVSPKAGDPIISDMIGVTVSVKDWQTDENKVEVPGS